MIAWQTVVWARIIQERPTTGVASFGPVVHAFAVAKNASCKTVEIKQVMTKEKCKRFEGCTQ